MISVLVSLSENIELRIKSFREKRQNDLKFDQDVAQSFLAYHRISSMDKKGVCWNLQLTYSSVSLPLKLLQNG